MKDRDDSFLVKQDSIDNLIETIERFAARPNPAFEMGRRGRENVIRVFSSEKYYDELLSNYREVLR